MGREKGHSSWNKGLETCQATKDKIRIGMSTDECKKMRIESAKKRWGDSAQRELASERSKALWQDPVYAENLRSIHKKRCNKPEYIQGFSALMKKCWADPEYARMMNDKKCEEANRLSISSKAKKRFEDPAYMKKVLHRRIPSYPEQSFIDLCKEFKYVGNGVLNIGGKNPDFVNVNDEHKLIEIWGRHFKEGRNPQDLIDFYKVRGYKCIIIWVSELRYPDKVLAKVMQFGEC